MIWATFKKMNNSYIPQAEDVDSYVHNSGTFTNGTGKIEDFEKVIT
jgi:hypothetical protein